MNLRILPTVLLTLGLVACGNDSAGNKETAQSSGTVEAPAQEIASSANGDTKSDVKEEAEKWVDQTKELGGAAWQSAKEAAADAADKSSARMETVKKQADEAYAATREKASEYYSNAKEKGAELYESAKAQGSEAWDKTKDKTDSAN